MTDTPETTPGSDILIARESGIIFAADGERYIIHKGTTRVRAGHPMLDGHEEMFAPLDTSVHYEVPDVETTRQSVKPGGRAAKKAAEPAKPKDD